MPIEILRSDITKLSVDAIVSTANPMPIISPGTESQIHKVAGLNLLMARQMIGRIEVGHAAITPAYDLDAKYVIHTVGPIWNIGNCDEEESLRNCYNNSLKLAVANKCKSIAFPLISTGNSSLLKDKALQVAISAFSTFLLEHEMHIYLVLFHRDTFVLSKDLYQQISRYINAYYLAASYGVTAESNTHKVRCLQQRDVYECCELSYPMISVTKSLSLEEMLKQEDAGFTETLLKLIDRSGKKDAEIYKKANISKQHFSKIRNNPNYKPTKPTAIALALALELNIKETKDLIGRAGFALTNSSKFDLIIQFFIEHGIYNVVEINLALYEFDQPLLGM